MCESLGTWLFLSSKGTLFGTPFASDLPGAGYSVKASTLQCITVAEMEQLLSRGYSIVTSQCHHIFSFSHHKTDTVLHAGCETPAPLYAGEEQPSLPS